MLLPRGTTFVPPKLSYLGKCKLESNNDYLYGSFAVHEDEIFIHTYDRKSCNWNICVFNKDECVRKLWQCNLLVDNWRLDEWVLCIKDKSLYTIATRSNRSVIFKLSLNGDLVNKFNVNIDDRFRTMLQVSDTYVVIVNLSILSVYSMEGRQIGCWNGDHLNLNGMVNLAIHKNSIYLTESSSDSDIHQFWLRNNSAGATLIHRKIIPHPESVERPRGLFATSRFLYLVCAQMRLVLLDQDGQHLASYSQGDTDLVNLLEGIQTNNLVLNGSVLYVYEFGVNEIHLWNLDKR